ncbi:nitroreductase, partial [bacterium]|nr:nitroreductase [bacterium]
ESAPGHEGWPAWAQSAAAAAQVAPSAMNRQPWRFSFSEAGLLVSTSAVEVPRAPKRLDCGIAMLHLELGAFGQGVTGSWRLLRSPDVALFVPDAG